MFEVFLFIWLSNNELKVSFSFKSLAIKLNSSSYDTNWYDSVYKDHHYSSNTQEWYESLIYFTPQLKWSNIDNIYHIVNYKENDIVTKLFPWFKASFFRILKQALVCFRSYQSTPEPIICSEYATFNCVGVLTAPGLGQSMF